ncbi:MAG: DUF896 domain-containing protein [Lachnospiraceae bacterium]|nr:DUF896 domain-containing protein [Lachnospiraceae bacterium]
MTEEKIARINELYHKMKNQGLSEQEKEEQAALRREYIAAMKADLANTLNRVRIVNPDGSIEELKKKHVQ